MEEDLLASSLLPRVVSEVGRHVRQGAAATAPPAPAGAASPGAAAVLHGSSMTFAGGFDSTSTPTTPGVMACTLWK